MLTSLRELRRYKAQAMLSLMGIALGVAVMVAVDLANESARRAFALSMEALTGKATHRIVSDNPLGIPEAYFAQLRVAQGIRAATPIVEGTLKTPDGTLRLFGVDPFTDRDFRPYSNAMAEGDLRALLVQPNTVLISINDEWRLSSAANGEIRVKAGGRSTSLTVVGRIVTDNPAALEGILLADIATAQEVLRRSGWIDSIDLILDDGSAARLAPGLPPGLRLENIRSDFSAQANMTAAFHTNLAAMGLLALLVGALLVYNTMSFSVLRRRHLLALMRVMGVTRSDIFHLVLIESLIFGTVGSLLGIGLGVLIGSSLVQLVTRTINDLYFVLTVSSLLVSQTVLLKGFFVGLITALLAALGPAWDAARTSPDQAMRRSGVERRMHGAAPWLAVVGGIVVGSGLILVALPSRDLLLAFGALFMVIIGFSLCVPWCVLRLGALLQPLMTRLFGRTGRLAARNVSAGLSRSGVAVAALAVAVSATVGVGTMIHSFRATVTYWLEQTLTSDIYVSLAGDSSTRQHMSLPGELVDKLRALPGVVSVSTGRPGELTTSVGKIPMLALGSAPHVADGFRFIHNADDAWPSFRAGTSLFVSEAMAFHHGLGIADRLIVQSPDGPLKLRISGIFFDYSSDRGMVVIDRATYARIWRDPGITTAGLKLASDADRESILASVRRQIAPLEIPLQVRVNAEIRGHSMDVFDRTFAITHVLRLLAVGVAFIGVLSALLALQLDRTREHATLRALGVTPVQLGGLMSLECGLMGLIAGILSLPLGWATAQLLIHVINKRSFGWSMQNWMPTTVFAEALFLAVAAALLAGLYPAWRLSALAPASALRDE